MCSFIVGSVQVQSSFYDFFFLMIRRPPRSTHCISSAASDVYKRQSHNNLDKQQSEKSLNSLKMDSTEDEVACYLEKDYNIFQCNLYGHQFQYSYICLDHRCQKYQQFFEPLCLICQKLNKHNQAQKDHKVNDLRQTLKELIKLSFAFSSDCLLYTSPSPRDQA
eukprot:TRINITY_DN9856_c0_g1_i1.p1 TRINITY_DN9856_c0_g1~~TRINITY_DN9856_c0_g1_i1.p1  ORF type:complete len:164 (-),score=32.29 TRINITY_DN9856_c0_g1_i1:63-554(-)